MKNTWIAIIVLALLLATLFYIRNLTQFKRGLQDTVMVEFADNSQGPLPEIGPAPDFELLGLNGPVNKSSLMGTNWIVDFIFTTCGGPCPKMSKNMAKLHRDFKDRQDLRFFSVSVDPEYDSIPVLAKYALSFKADTTRWNFLTGTREDIHEFAVEGLKLPADEHVVSHSTYFVLVDDKGEIRGYYSGTNDEDMVRLATDLTRLLPTI